MVKFRRHNPDFPIYSNGTKPGTLHALAALPNCRFQSTMGVMLSSLYKHGFLALPDTKQVPEYVSTWETHSLDNYTLFTDSDLPILVINGDDGSKVISIGDIFVAHGEETLEDNLRRILQGDCEPLNNLSGWFVLFIQADGDIRVIHDPIGSKAVFYSSKELAVVGSHPSLVAEVEQAKPNRRFINFTKESAFRRRTTRYLPGDQTLYTNIFHLIPNNQFYLKSGKTERYWPNKAVQLTSFDDFTRDWDEYFTNYCKFLGQKYSPVTGLTPGVDTRSVVASIRRNGVPLRYVTWEPIRESEKPLVEPLAQYLGVENHQWLRHIDSDEKTRQSNLIELTKLATGGLKRGSTLPIRLSSVNGPNNVFIKGLGGEILRGSFSRKKRQFLPVDPLALFVRVYAGPSRDLVEDNSYTEMVKFAGSEYLARANFTGHHFNIDAGDLLYWEARMGTYGSLGQLEIAVAMPAHAAINSRHLFASAFGLPDEIRLSRELLMKVARRLDPEFAKFPTS